MIFKNKRIHGQKVVFYQEKKIPTWHRYADILVPLITLPLLLVIGLHLHNYIVDSSSQKNPIRWKVFALSIAMLLISFAVFCYICMRLTPVLGGRRSRVRLPMIRSFTTSNNCFMRSVNSDLQLILPFQEQSPSYESIIFDVPPSYVGVKKEGCNSKRIIEL